MKLRRRLVLASSFASLALVSLAACSAATESEEQGETADAISISNLVHLAKGDLDRSKPDPFNPWAKKALAIGEENRLPDEDAEFKAIGSLVNRFQEHAKAEASAAKVSRAFHAKTHACVRGELSLDVSALPASAKVGLFAANAKYGAWARFSNGVGSKQSDKKLDMRGFAIKILGVPGARAKGVPGNDTATTQDFLMANQPIAPASDARHMMAFGEAMMGSADSGTLLGKVDNLIQAGAFLTSDENVRIVDFLANWVLDKTRNTGSLLGDTYFTGAPYALGLEAGDPTTAKAKGAFKLVAKTGVVKNGKCTPIVGKPNDKDPEFMRTDLEKRFAESDVCADLFVQLQEDPAAQPVEDVSVPWKSAQIPVGTIVFEKRKLAEGAADQAKCENFSFQPWHSLEVHRPLGNAMRARRYALPSSASLRNADGREPTP